MPPPGAIRGLEPAGAIETFGAYAGIWVRAGKLPFARPGNYWAADFVLENQSHGASILRVDLGSMSWSTNALDEADLRRFIGGPSLAALTAASNDRVFVVACDMPFVSADAITGLTRLLDDHDAVVPRVDSQFETLHAV